MERGLRRGAFANNFQLASTLFHEYYHGFQAVSGIRNYVILNIGAADNENDIGTLYLETQAYRFQLFMEGSNQLENTQKRFNEKLELYLNYE